MTHELILTSVSQGLEPDSRGFCAVAADRGISQHLIKRLTTLSEYEHPSSSDSEESRHPPVVYSHLIVPGLDSSWHVLSRVSDTGLDFKHDPNRLAHHVVLSENELVPEGPAWLLGLHGFHFSEWLTPAVRFDRGRLIPTLTAPPPLTRRQRIARERVWLDPWKMSPVVPPPENTDTLQSPTFQNEEQRMISGPPSSPCPLWQELTGDAGWGGVLAETIRTGRPVLVLYNPGMNIFPLFVEALALLPPPLFWKATFSTYFQRIPEHIPCQWKGLLAGSDEAKRLSDAGDSLVLDLTHPLGPAPVGPYVEYARRGIEGLLPADEIQETPFEEDDFDTKTIFPENDGRDDSELPPLPVGRTETDAADSDGPLLAAVSESDESLIPPVLPTEAVKIRTRSSRKKQGFLDSLLNMKSRGRFYVLYGTTLLVLLVFLVLLLDQFADFGIARWFQGSSGQVSNGNQPDAGSDPKPGNGTKQNPAAAQAERERKEKERQEKLQAEKRRQAERRAKAVQARIARREKAQRDAMALEDHLADFKTPDYLPLQVPTIRGNTIVPLEQPQVFHELASFHPFGLALELNVMPLLDIPNARIETRKHGPDSDDLPQDDADSDLPEKAFGEKPDDDPMESEKDDFAGENVSETKLMEGESFDWTVYIVDTQTLNETPMLQLSLTEAGLRVVWDRSCMSQQHFYDALWASLGFLRLSVQDETATTKIRSVSLFEPREVDPVFLAKKFATPGQPELSIESPLAREPWKTLLDPLAPPGPPFTFRLEAELLPKITSGIQGMSVRENLPPAQFFADIKTEISARKVVAADRETYEPVVISIEGTAGPDRVVWTDRYEDQARILKEELDEALAKRDDIKKEYETVRKELFNAGTKAIGELGKKKTDLENETKELTNRIDEIRSIREKLPLAHDKIIGNDQLRIRFSVFLVPLETADGSSGPENAFPENEKNTVPRFQGEESLLLMTTVEKVAEKEKIDVSIPIPSLDEGEEKDSDDTESLPN